MKQSNTPMKTVKIQYIRTKLQVETATDLLNKTITAKRNEKAKLLFQKDLDKANLILKKNKAKVVKAITLAEKQEKELDLEIRKATHGKIQLDGRKIDKDALKTIGQLGIKNRYYSTTIKETENTNIGVYENLIKLDKEQEKIDAFILEMILGKVTATELTALINNIKKIK